MDQVHTAQKKRNEQSVHPHVPELNQEAVIHEADQWNQNGQPGDAIQQNGYRIGYASSADLMNWVRDDAKAGIDVSAQGWDAEMISYPHVFELDGKTYMAYLGDQVGRNGFGLAVLEGRLG